MNQTGSPKPADPVPDTALDTRFMGAAIRLARIHQGWTATNPSVACILVRNEGDGPYIVGTGVTAIGGRPHAEPIAIAEAGRLAAGSTAYVTLEPCAHHGRTAPCAQNLIDAGVHRVVTAVVDPDERVNGKGHAMLRDAGIIVDAGVCSDDAEKDLSAYLVHKQTGKPWVTLKLAISKDGFIGIRECGQVTITGKLARARTHLLRARNQAILIGSGTAIADNPELTCRLHGLALHSPLRVVLDANGRIDPQSRLVQTARNVPTLIVSPEAGNPRQNRELRDAGCDIMVCEIADGRIALPELLDDLGARGVMRLLVEGGAAIASSFVAEGLVDEMLLFRGSTELGRGKDRIASPVDFDRVCDGFVLTGEWKFGEDLARHFQRRK